MATGISFLEDDTEGGLGSLYLSKDEALRTQVLPRSYGEDLKPRTALSVPSRSAEVQQPSDQGGVLLSDLLASQFSIGTQQPAEKQPEQGVLLSDLLSESFGVVSPVQEAAKPATEESGDTGRGFTTALEQTPALAYGALGFAGAAGEKAFGAGGAMTSLKNFGLREYQTRMKAIGETAKESDDVTKAWAKAQQGDLGALVDWAQYGVGYLGGSIVETVATSALGSLAGGLAAGPVGAVAGVGAGAVGKQAVQGVAKNLIEGMVSA
jgi:hypothetical protein